MRGFLIGLLAGLALGGSVVTAADCIRLDDLSQWTVMVISPDGPVPCGAPTFDAGQKEITCFVAPLPLGLPQ
jgi:hypothetical protein